MTTPAPSASTTAAHEAGHAAATLLSIHVGLPLRSISTVTIIRDGNALGLTTPEPLGWKPELDIGDLESRAPAETLIVMGFAGPMAEARHVGTTATLWGVRNGTHDGAFIDYMVRKLTHGRAERNSYVGYLWQRTISLTRVPAFWPSVDALAAELEISGKMSGTVALAIVREVERSLDRDDWLRHGNRLSRWRDGGIPPAPTPAHADIPL